MFVEIPVLSLLLLVVVVASTSDQFNDDHLYFDKSKPNSETTLTAEDFVRAKYAFGSRHRDAPSNDDVLYRRDRFEGDIVGPNLRSLRPNRRSVRNAMRDRWQLWPNKRIPYTLSARYSSYSRSKIAAAMDEFSRRTCVRFVPRTNEPDYVFLEPDDGCYSTIGRSGGRQTVSLGSGCVNFGIILHELLHSLSFSHEQSRPDRDEFVTVNWTNIADDMMDQFIKFDTEMIDTMGFTYDFSSILHYSSKAFSKNGQATIVPKVDGVHIGQRDGFSSLDTAKIHALYSCHQSETEDVTSNFDLRPVTVPSESQCLDEMTDCGYRQSLGYCQTLAHWMNKYCKLTCGICRPSGEQTSQCEDTNNYCETWAQAGFCDRENFTDYMRRNCKKSCLHCRRFVTK